MRLYSPASLYPRTCQHPTSIAQATENIAYLSELKATGQLDLDFANSLIADNRAILDALVEEAKLIAAQGGPQEQTIKIESGLPELPGTNVIMPHMNGHELNGRGPVINADTQPAIEPVRESKDAS